MRPPTPPVLGTDPVGIRDAPSRSKPVPQLPPLTLRSENEYSLAVKYAVFFGLALFSLSPWASPGLALALGLVVALSGQNPDSKRSGKVSKRLLQVCVIALGLSMDLGLVLRAGANGFVLAAATIVIILVLGRWLGQRLKVDDGASALISAGTAICGGSAIAAVGSVIAATEAEMAVAMATTFCLNGVALYLFPPLGHALGLSAEQFGNWAGIAIHDISSVVGAASIYSPQALEVATAVKLSRTLWIIPVALFFATTWKKRTDSQERPALAVPWFIGGFLLASLVRSLVPAVEVAVPTVVVLSKAGMRLTLYLIGAGVSMAALKAVGARPLIQGVILWIILGGTSLLALMHGTI